MNKYTVNESFFNELEIFVYFLTENNVLDTLLRGHLFLP